ncbi:MAG: molybdopterin-binding protein, partial [Phycisphaerae bacterium]|nr:molybdopterin-binding protein [Phycisphaerae bacterium]
MNAIIISIGDELISGRTVDTNSAYLAGRLGEFGIFTLSHHTVGDEVDAVASAIRLAAARARIVLVTGGLGPTADDLTRQGLAMAMNSELVLNETCLAEIEEFFRRRGRRMVSANRIQAMIPVGGQAIPNRVGTAPGLAAKLGEAVIFVMPGVPQEMREMFDAFVLPRLPKSPGRIVQRLVHTCGMGESDVGEKISDLMQARGGNVIIGTTVA